VLARPIAGPGDPSPIATILLARRIDVGLEGLFAHARLLVGIFAAALLVIAVVGHGLSGARRV